MHEEWKNGKHLDYDKNKYQISIYLENGIDTCLQTNLRNSLVYIKIIPKAL
jgi:hypothetical protein